MEREWSLSEVARLLRQPQHRLIYLCEKGAIVPDFGNARGRGSSRRFSTRNVLEFAIALQLRGLGLPVSTAGSILHALRSFEATVRKDIPTFGIVDDLRRRDAPDLLVLVAEGPRVYFSLGRRGRQPRLFGGINLPPRRRSRPRDIPRLAPKAATLRGHAKVELNVTEVAKSLDLKS